MCKLLLVSVFFVFHTLKIATQRSHIYGINNGNSYKLKLMGFNQGENSKQNYSG